MLSELGFWSFIIRFIFELQIDLILLSVEGLRVQVLNFGYSMEGAFIS